MAKDQECCETPTTSPRHLTTNASIISDNAILNAVQVEFDRTLPFWRCYVDVRLDENVMNVRPAVFSRDTTLVCRIPCKVFRGVDVVWARTHVTVRVPLKWSRTKQYRYDSPEVGLSRYWRDMEYREERFTLGTMHFVHHDAHRKGSAGGDRSFHIQSVVLYDDPALLQCVAGTMVAFAAMVYGSLRLVSARLTRGKRYTPLPDTSEDVLTEVRLTYLPPATARILILGMGGNSMALCLRKVLGPDADLHVVEVEPAVVEACRIAQTLPSEDREDPHLHVHLAEADAFLRACTQEGLSEAPFDVVFMDIFEPMHAKMDKSDTLVQLSLARLRPGGLLVVNDHQLPSPEGLRPFCELVGTENIQAVNLHGWNESVVVCVKPGDPHVDGLSVHCHKRIATDVFDLYEAILPGWLPHVSWLKTSLRVPSNTGCRVWTS